MKTYLGKSQSDRGILFLLTVLSITLWPVGALSAAVWIVDDDGGPGVDFLDIPPAVAAAAPGDLILVRDGLYGAPYVDKGLTIAADTGHGPVVQGTVTVHDVPWGEAFAISGMQLNRLRAEQSQGSILVDDCQIIHESQCPLEISYCERVFVSRCGTKAGNFSFNGPLGAWMEYATVVISGSSFEGGEGQEAWDWDAGDGGCGLMAYKCDVYLFSSSARGGDGGDCMNPEYNAGSGGEGVFAQYSTLHLFGTEVHQIEGGAAGWGAWGVDASAAWIWDSKLFYSGVTFIPKGSKPAIHETGSKCKVQEITPPVPVILLAGSGQMGGGIKITLDGEPGSLFLLYLAATEAVIPLGKMYTHLMLDPTTLLFLAGGVILPGSPPLFEFHIPPQATAFQGMPIHFQAYVETALGQSYLSTSASFVLR